MEDRSFAQATLAAQVDLVIPLQFCPGDFLGSSGQQLSSDAASAQESHEASHDEGCIGRALLGPAGFCHERDRLCFVQFREGDAVRRHQLGEVPMQRR
jgi:hypothetical protein